MTGPDGDRQVGSIEAKVREDIGALLSDHPMGESLAELAFMLACRLDDATGTKDLAVAGISKELRETLLALAASKAGDDDSLAAALSVPA